MNRQQIEEWYEEECQKAGQPQSKVSVPFQEKWLAYSLVAAVPAVLIGCSPEPVIQSSPPKVQNTATTVSHPTSNRELTAYEECMWERESLGDWELDCGDDSSTWYSSRGYSSRHSYVPSSSKYYQKMKGGASSSSSPKAVTSSPKQVTPSPSSMSSGSGSYKSGVGTGGMSSGGTSTGG
ncbi:hypothetical protein [Ammoniphilus sp. CFH 90114]|uniref:hypothetical protein n=1 Tax=Ammoniphilus sp. CFH 90114 TaxID=2493665 RepID=UPI00100DAB2D|nr:hypothetical protein [Ammoniphilus sp. CFH 90114]RXT07869.1 hypothetical protein EIZ39_10615 [Ammoniphilus sp. CFH 90114]